jgi:molecular chaperone GrpE
VSDREERLRRLVSLWEREEAAGAQVEPDPAGADLPEVDLCTLFAEWTALKAEVRSETRASRDLRAELAGAIAGLGEAERRAATREASLSEEVRRAGREAPRRAAWVAIDLADRLEAARARARRHHEAWWRRADPVATALLEGLDLTLERLRELLAREAVERIPTEGRPFDPSLMEAVQVVERSDLAEGTVVAEILAGYRDPAGLLRPARVSVSRPLRRDPQSTEEEGP